MFFEIADASRGPAGTLVDQHTGQRSLISKPGREQRALSGPWLVFDCPGLTPQIALYRLSRGTWRTIAAPTSDSTALVVGTDWIEWLNPVPSSDCFDANNCLLLFGYTFQNLDT